MLVAEADQLGLVPALVHLLELPRSAPELRAWVGDDLGNLTTLGLQSPHAVEDALGTVVLGHVDVHGSDGDAGEKDAPHLLVDPGALLDAAVLDDDRSKKIKSRDEEGFARR